jgi:hypothetical protein
VEREQSNSLHVGDVFAFSICIMYVMSLCVVCYFWDVSYISEMCIYIGSLFPLCTSVTVSYEMSLPSHLGYFDPTIEFGMLSTLQKCVYMYNRPLFPLCMSISHRLGRNVFAYSCRLFCPNER